MKSLTRQWNRADTEIGDVIHECSLGYRGSSALASSFQNNLEAQTWSTGHIHLNSTLGSIKSKCKAQKFASYLTHKYIWILHSPKYLNSSLRTGEKKVKNRCLLIKNMGNQLVYLQVAVSTERKSMETHQAIFRLVVSGPVSSLAIVAGCDSPPPALSLSNCVGWCALSSAVQHLKGCSSEPLLSEGPPQLQLTCLRAIPRSHWHRQALSEQCSIS